MAISTGQGISLGLQTLALATLAKSDALNRFANWISGGKINRDTLAQKIWHKAVELGTDYAMQSKPLGVRTAALVPLARDALADNDMGRMKDAIVKLTSTVLGDFVAPGLGRTALEGVSQAVMGKLGDSLGDHAVEKVLTTMVKQHGWQGLENNLKSATGGGVLGNFITSRIKDVIQHAMVDNPAFDQSDNPEYRLLAGALNSYLSGSGDYERHLRDYAPTLTGIIGTVQSVRDMVSPAVDLVASVLPSVSTIKQGIDNLQDTLGITSGTVRAQDLFSTAMLYGAPKPEIDESTKPRDLVQNLVLDVVNNDDSRPSMTVSQKLDEVAPTLGDTQRQKMTEVVSLLSPDQIRPLGERSGVEIGSTWVGTIDRVETQSHKVGMMSEDSLGEVDRALKNAPGALVDVGGYRVGEGYSRQIKSLALDLPKDSMGYTDSTVEGGRALWNTGWGLLGYSTGPDWGDSSVLKQLYNTCGKNEGVMQEVTRYLDKNLARDAIGLPMLDALAGDNPGELDIGGVRVKLDGNEPSAKFTVRNEGEFVRVSIDVEYGIESYGKGDDLREPHGNGDSRVTASVTILVRPGEDGAPPTTTIHPLGDMTSIFNTVAFDRQTGDIRRSE